MKVAALLAVLLGIAAVWQWSPVSSYLDPVGLAEWGSFLRGQWWGYLAVMGVYVLAGLLVVPQAVLIAATVALYGPTTGLAVALAGSLVNGAALFVVGDALGGRHLRRHFGEGRIHQVSQMLASRGALSMIVIRQLPIAPYSVVNFAAGASHIRFGDYMIGTAIGILPWTVVVVLLSEQFFGVLRAPSMSGATLFAASFLLAVGIGWLAARSILAWLRRRDSGGSAPR